MNILSLKEKGEPGNALFGLEEKKEMKAFYLRHSGNGARELIFVELGMRIIELSAGNLNVE